MLRLACPESSWHVYIGKGRVWWGLVTLLKNHCLRCPPIKVYLTFVNFRNACTLYNLSYVTTADGKAFMYGVYSFKIGNYRHNKTLGGGENQSQRLRFQQWELKRGDDLTSCRSTSLISCVGPQIRNLHA